MAAVQRLQPLSIALNPDTVVGRLRATVAASAFLASVPIGGKLVQDLLQDAMIQASGAAVELLTPAADVQGAPTDLFATRRGRFRELHMSRTPDQVLASIAGNQVPDGFAWDHRPTSNTMRSLWPLAGFASTFETTAEAQLQEATPKTAELMLGAYERVLGPDTCLGDPATLSFRRAPHVGVGALDHAGRPVGARADRAGGRLWRGDHHNRAAPQLLRRPALRQPAARPSAAVRLRGVYAGGPGAQVRLRAGRVRPKTRKRVRSSKRPYKKSSNAASVSSGASSCNV